MSLLNYLGKVNTTFVPYTSNYEDVKWRRYEPMSGENRLLRTTEKVEILEYTGFITRKNNAGIYDRCIYYTDEAKTKKTTLLFDAEKGSTHYSDLFHWFCRPCMVSSSVPQREYILEDFPDIVKKITKKHPVPILSGLNLPQMVTVPELLWLKVDDVDSRTDYLEKMLAQVIEDNKLLQQLVNDLECRIENLELS